VGDGISVRISGAKSERFREEWIAPIASLEIVGVPIDFGQLRLLHWELWVSRFGLYRVP
jgi:hypothetical protein